jgi:hypothetical protein
MELVNFRHILPAVALGATVAAFLTAQTQRERNDPLAQFERRIAKGEAKLEFDDRWGYLPSLLKNLDLNVDSQVLVFSKTSLQQEKIGPKTPRAVYFNDTISIGSVQDGELIEIAAVDPVDGIHFYSLDPKKVEKPEFERQGQLCNLCHGPVNRWAPGIMVATVYPNAEGTPFFMGGGELFRTTDSSSPFEERWGGWYVSGTHGSMKHLGNAWAPDPYHPVEMITENTQNVTDLTAKFDTAKYLAPTSDLIALMTLEHQTKITNLITRVNAQLRFLKSNQLPAAQMPKQSDVDKTIQEIITFMLFENEFPLTSPVAGVSTFTKTFPERGPRDSKGRSLRDFDLKTRLFRYRLSYMIYSELFDNMNPTALERVYRGMYEKLQGTEALEIVRATKPNLPAYWR